MGKPFALPGFESSDEPPADPDQLHTLYFMLMLPAAAREQASQVRAQLQASVGLSGSFIEPRRLHLSLLSLGRCWGEPPALWLNALRHAAQSVQAPAVPLELDCARSFNRAFVLQSSRPNQALNQLRKALRRALRKVGWCSMSSTVGHVTLSYEPHRHDRITIRPLCWIANSFCLIDSVYGRHEHRLLGEWPLQAGAGNDKGPAEPARCSFETLDGTDYSAALSTAGVSGRSTSST